MKEGPVSVVAGTVCSPSERFWTSGWAAGGDPGVKGGGPAGLAGLSKCRACRGLTGRTDHVVPRNRPASQATDRLVAEGRRGRAASASGQYAVAETGGVSEAVASIRDWRREVCGDRGSLRLSRLAGEMAAAG